MRAVDNIDESGDEPKIIEELRKVSLAGSWVLYKISGSAAYFYSSQDIICSHVNPAANVDMSVNMGRYTAMVNLTSNKIYKLDDLYHTIYIASRTYDNTIHPHATAHSICWGSARHTIQELALDCNLTRQFTLLDELLACYSPSNPYATLRTFQRARNTRVNNDLDYEEFPQWMLQDILGENYEQDRWDDSQKRETQEEQDTTEQDDGISEEDSGEGTIYGESVTPNLIRRSPITATESERRQLEREAAAQEAFEETNRWVIPDRDQIIRNREGYTVITGTPPRDESEDTIDIPF